MTSILIEELRRRRNKLNSRKLILVEYDEEGKEVDRNCLSENEQLSEIFIPNPELASTLIRCVNDRYLLDKCDRDRFTPGQWDIMEKYEYPSPVDIWTWEDDDEVTTFSNATLNDDLVAFWERFFSSCKEKQKFVQNLFNNGFKRNRTWLVEPGHKLDYDEEDFVSCFEWVDKTDGVYYCQDYKREKMWDYLNEIPTIKQFKDQSKARWYMVFLDFKDWKEHHVYEKDCRKELVI